jgi:ABC-type antimicrobial peptide transport system permease subunit
VVLRGVRYAAIGVGVGLAGALAVTRVMRTLLFGVSAADPVTFVGLAVLLILIAALASYLPARQASTINPMEAMRAD